MILRIMIAKKKNKEESTEANTNVYMEIEKVDITKILTSTKKKKKLKSIILKWKISIKMFDMYSYLLTNFKQK